MKKCYLRNKHNQPVTLIAYEIVGGVITYGTSTCHPKDVNDKKLGHLIAEGRARSRKAHTVFQRHANPLVDITFDIRRHGTYMKRENTRWYQAAYHYLTVVPAADLDFLPSELPPDVEQVAATGTDL